MTKVAEAYPDTIVGHMAAVWCRPTGVWPRMRPTFCQQGHRAARAEQRRRLVLDGSGGVSNAVVAREGNVRHGAGQGGARRARAGHESTTTRSSRSGPRGLRRGRTPAVGGSQAARNEAHVRRSPQLRAEARPSPTSRATGTAAELRRAASCPKRSRSKCPRRRSADESRREEAGKGEGRRQDVR